MIQLYLKLINQAYPNGGISADDSTKLYLREIKLPYKPYQERPEDYINMNAAVYDIKQLGLAQLQLQPNLPDYWTFKWSMAPYNSSIVSLLEKTGLAIYVQNPSTFTAINSKELFSSYFEPLLAKKGITDIDVQADCQQALQKS